MIPLNVQPIEKSVDNDLIDVQEIFSTIQGEGPFTGERAIFLRLAGCDLCCPLCDTDYTSSRALLGVETILYGIDSAFSKFQSMTRDTFVVITGGEPLRQNIGPLIERLIHDRMHGGIAIQIETNGTLFRDNLPWSSPHLSVVCSPKTPQINLNLTGYVNAYKYVLRAGEMDQEDGLPTAVLGTDVRPFRRPFGSPATIYVNPADEGDPEKNQANLQACIDSCKRFGHRLGVQLHKIINVP